jgi:hypothetical protein
MAANKTNELQEKLDRAYEISDSKPDESIAIYRSLAKSGKLPVESKRQHNAPSCSSCTFVGPSVALIPAECSVTFRALSFCR